VDSTQIHWVRVWNEASPSIILEKITSRVNPVLQNLRKILACTACSIVVEAGCGNGYVIRSLGEEFRGTFFVGVDYSKEGIRFAKSKCPSENVHFVLGDVRNLPLRPSSTDLITSFGVIEHFSKVGSSHIIAESFLTLKPSGFLFVETPNRRTFGLSEKMAKSLSEYFGNHAFYTAAELAQFVISVLPSGKHKGQLVLCQTSGFAHALVWSLTNQYRKNSMPFSFLAKSLFLVGLSLSVCFKDFGLFSQVIIRKVSVSI
jgi:2-polyprenyl-3-methyl-5-hydroxy-6-metoxy-1,4-benzoquinol methylase